MRWLSHPVAIALAGIVLSQCFIEVSLWSSDISVLKPLEIVAVCGYIPSNLDNLYPSIPCECKKSQVPKIYLIPKSVAFKIKPILTEIFTTHFTNAVSLLSPSQRPRPTPCSNSAWRSSRTASARTPKDIVAAAIGTRKDTARVLARRNFACASRFTKKL